MLHLFFLGRKNACERDIWDDDNFMLKGHLLVIHEKSCFRSQVCFSVITGAEEIDSVCCSCLADKMCSDVAHIIFSASISSSII